MWLCLGFSPIYILARNHWSVLGGPLLVILAIVLSMSSLGAHSMYWTVVMAGLFVALAEVINRYRGWRFVLICHARLITTPEKFKIRASFSYFLSST